MAYKSPLNNGVDCRPVPSPKNSDYSQTPAFFTVESPRNFGITVIKHFFLDIVLDFYALFYNLIRALYILTLYLNFFPHPEDEQSANI